jgi:hypothetical protein
LGAGVLPDDRVVDRLAGELVPHHGGLALVGDADGGDLMAVDVGLGQGLPTTSRTLSQISTGLCSTQPARGKICSCSFWPGGDDAAAWSKMIARELVVPWSMARTYF